MQINKGQLQRFIELYQEEFGITLSRAEAQDSAHKLVLLVKTLLTIGQNDDFFA